MSDPTLQISYRTQLLDSSRYHLSSTPAQYERAAPHFGRDARMILREILGYDESRITELTTSGLLR
jgi:crotonobetainyl-CoA:carnitine CoA-transferase CaiB-like acyl-CoA transferase